MGNKQRFLAAAVAASLLWARPVAGLSEGDWVTRGKTGEHRSVVTEPAGAMEFRKQWELELGTAGSQPLFVKGRIYHLTERGLFAISPEGEILNGGRPLLGSWINRLPSADAPRPSSSSLTYEVVRGEDLLYFGTGGNQICAYNLTRDTGWCSPLGGTEPVVTTPLVFKPVVKGAELDVVIMGDKAGGLWAVTNLAFARREDEVGWVRRGQPHQSRRDGVSLVRLL